MKPFYRNHHIAHRYERVVRGAALLCISQALFTLLLRWVFVFQSQNMNIQLVYEPLQRGLVKLCIARLAPARFGANIQGRFKFQHVQTRVRMLDRRRGRRQSHLTQNITGSQWCKEPWWKRLYETTVSPQLPFTFQRYSPYKETDSVMYSSFTKCM